MITFKQLIESVFTENSSNPYLQDRIDSMSKAAPKQPKTMGHANMVKYHNQMNAHHTIMAGVHHATGNSAAHEAHLKAAKLHDEAGKDHDEALYVKHSGFPTDWARQDAVRSTNRAKNATEQVDK